MTVTTAHLLTGDAWVSAYVVGLARSSRSDVECISELLGVSRARLDVLDDATHLLGEVSDPAVRERAFRLVDEAVRAACAHPAGRRLALV